MEGEGHHAVGEVEGLLDAVAMVDIDVDVPGMVRDTTGQPARLTAPRLRLGEAPELTRGEQPKPSPPVPSREPENRRVQAERCGRRLWLTPKTGRRRAALPMPGRADFLEPAAVQHARVHLGQR